MVAYAIVLLTDLDDVNTVAFMEVQTGTDMLVMRGEVVRSFVQCTNKAYETFPEAACLEEGLKLIPPTLQPVFAHLYEKLGGIII